MLAKLLTLSLVGYLALSQALNIQSEDNSTTSTNPAASAAAPAAPTNKYDYIIVGAGIAGIAASTVFTDQNKKHLILEARDRIGGRIGKGNFSGISIDIGANFIHFPESNYLDDVVNNFGIGKVPANFQIQTTFYTNKSAFSTNDLTAGDAAFNASLMFVNAAKNTLQTDASVASVLKNFWAQNTNYSAPIVDRVNQKYQVEGVQNAADLSQMSTYEFDGTSGKGALQSTDYIPAGGWNVLIQTIYDQWCEPDLHLSELVTAVDYSGDNIIVTTSKGNYTTNNLFVSVSLGLLKANSIKFSPALPADKQKAINSIGFGAFQKLFVQFDSAFWPAGSSTLHFIGQGEFSRYVQGWVVPNTLGLNVLVFFVSGQNARTLVNWSNDAIKNDLLTFLSSYTNQTVGIKNLWISKWSTDPYALGSYSYAAVGTQNSDFDTLQKVITNKNNKIWLIGEHTDSGDYSYTQGGYQSGESAALEALGIS